MPMKESMRSKLSQLARRLEEIDAQLASEDTARDMNKIRTLGQERAEIEPVVTRFHEFNRARADELAAQEMLSDPDMKALAEEEIHAARARIESLEADLQRLLLPRDPNDERNVFLEVRAGTGGDESALFAGDLLRMYLRFAERNRWKTEILSESASDLGGYKEVIVRIEGQGAYSKLKFESGGHRVQRVPETEAQGRIHTSACTVAVLPEADEINDVKIDPTEIRIDVYRASGAGGQHVNKTESAVRITHLPTGLVVECQDDRSQHKNKERAMKILAARIKDKQVQEQQKKEASQRKSLIGSGDRSERIRTYNFPQGRVTDHRINLTLYKIEQIMDGDIHELTQALTAEFQAEQLAALGDS
jgi:peptide chain release factor 1